MAYSPQSSTTSHIFFTISSPRSARARQSHHCQFTDSSVYNRTAYKSLSANGRCTRPEDVWATVTHHSAHPPPAHAEKPFPADFKIDMRAMRCAV